MKVNNIQLSRNLGISESRNGTRFAFGFKATAFLVVFLAAVAFGFVSCSDDDDDDDTSLTAPTYVVVVPTSTLNQVQVVWYPTGASYYWVYYNTTEDSSTATLLSSTVSSTSYTTVLSESGTYYFWVKSAAGSSLSSNTSDFSEYDLLTDFEYTLSAPTNVSVTKTSSTQVTVSWTSTGADWYYVYYSTTNYSSTATDLNITSFSTSNYTYSTTVTLSSSGTYYFWVKSVDDYQKTYEETSGFSSYASITITIN